MGIMGAAMARRLVEAGYGLIVWNRSAEKCRPLVEAGAEAAESPADLMRRGPEVVFLNLTDTPAVESVVFGEGGLCEGLRADASSTQQWELVDHSTIEPLATEKMADRLAGLGGRWVDAPVSGGDTGAKEGTLSIMVGGEVDAFERVKPLLEHLGRSVVHLGPAGSGQICKACNQVAVAGTLLAVCEAMALARRCGLDLQQMIRVVGQGAGGSWQMNQLGPKIADGDHAPGFMVDLVLKDLAIVQQTARQKHLPLTATALVESYFRAVAASGGGKQGTQALAGVLESLGGFRFAEQGNADRPEGQGI
jgi:3-hydroxyisobutyrate dehydrogenase